MKQTHIAVFTHMAAGHVCTSLDVRSELIRRGHRVTFPANEFFAPEAISGLIGWSPVNTASGERSCRYNKSQQRSFETHRGGSKNGHINIDGVCWRTQGRQERACDESQGECLEGAVRLHDRYRKLVARGKGKQQTATVVARELLGFI